MNNCHLREIHYPPSKSSVKSWKEAYKEIRAQTCIWKKTKMSHCWFQCGVFFSGPTCWYLTKHWRSKCDADLLVPRRSKSSCTSTCIYNFNPEALFLTNSKTHQWARFRVRAGLSLISDPEVYKANHSTSHRQELAAMREACKRRIWYFPPNRSISPSPFLYVLW